MESGEEPEGHPSGDGQRRKKLYHRHTPHQIQQLEGFFKECPHPDEKQRMQLSRDLGLELRQVKFWFQNRRTQMKAQHERADNCSLRAENDKIRCENIAIREALKKVICPSCGGPPLSDDSYFDEQKLRMENARLKEELDRVSSIASKYLGRPITQLPPVQPVQVSSLDLSVGGPTTTGFGPSLDLDLLPGTSSTFPFPTAISDAEKPVMADIAAGAMDELIRLVQTDEPMWIKAEGKEILNLETYDKIFPRSGSEFTGYGVSIEASRDTGIVIMGCLPLVNMFIDPSKWSDLFPTIVLRARTFEVLSPGVSVTRSGTLLLMYEEIQVLSPVVPTREFFILRYCQQIEPGLWAIANVSVDLSRNGQFGPPSASRRLPSGCLIQEMSSGYCKVTWVEHMEIREKTPINRLYRDLITSGVAFGASRWIATLQRMCERMACQMANATSPRELGGVIPSPEGKRSMMKLAQRMMKNFCSSICSSNGQRWTTLSVMNEVGVKLTYQKGYDPGQPSGVVFSAAKSIWLPVSSHNVFSFFKDERTRAQWDILWNGNTVQEVAHITNGSHPGNCISLLRAMNSNQNNMLILQESCTDSSGSIVVYTPVDLAGINVVMSGEDPSYIPLLPSGFIIVPDGRPGGGSGASSSSNPMGSSSGSLVTVAFQILVSSLPSAKLSYESITTVNNLISTTVQQIKAALNCSNV